MGVATYDEETNRDIDHLYSHADQALYAAKKNGRNRVVAYSNISSYFLVDPLKKQGQSLRKSAASNEAFKSRTDS
ncbi:GGDEF domain-containing protein [Carnobacterium mobile]|uniref:GGDEF domain-containing protein n=1 Tax=Carnobacterium mobile TaxID=2750 RepID=UPI00384D461B